MTHAEALKLLDASIERLRAGIFGRLNQQYAARFGTESQFLSAAILNEAVLEGPSNKKAEEFRAKNASLISDEAMKMHLNVDLAQGLSYLYAAQTLYLVWLTKSPFSARAQALGEKATELNIHIPSTFDICGSDDAMACIAAIYEYASDFVSSL